jgi:hypothetical protein
MSSGVTTAPSVIVLTSWVLSKGTMRRTGGTRIVWPILTIVNNKLSLVTKSEHMRTVGGLWKATTGWPGR